MKLSLTLPALRGYRTSAAFSHRQTNNRITSVNLLRWPSVLVQPQQLIATPLARSDIHPTDLICVVAIAEPHELTTRARKRLRTATQFLRPHPSPRTAVGTPHGVSPTISFSTPSVPLSFSGAHDPLNLCPYYSRCDWNTTTSSDISSCYYPQPWELRPIRARSEEIKLFGPSLGYPTLSIKVIVGMAADLKADLIERRMWAEVSSDSDTLPSSNLCI